MTVPELLGGEVRVNVLPGLMADERGLLELLMSAADRPEEPWVDVAGPAIQVIPEQGWASAMSERLRPDYAFGLAEGSGRITTWREARLLEGERVVYPNESSHAPRLMLWGFSPQLIETAGEPELNVYLDILSIDLPWNWELAAIAKDLMNELRLSSTERTGVLSRLRIFGRFGCRYNRVPSGGCGKGNCPGECRGYQVSDGPVDRDICTCVL
jgi:hypothetical protein